MAAMVVTERHLWLSLLGIRVKDMSFLLGALICPSGLFGTSVEIVVERFKEVRTQSAAFRRCIAWKSESKPSDSSKPSDLEGILGARVRSLVCLHVPPFSCLHHVRV